MLKSHRNPKRVLSLVASVAAGLLVGLSACATPAAASTSANQSGPAALTCARGDATVFALAPDGRTISETTLMSPAAGGPSAPRRHVVKLPFDVRAMAAITASTLFVTDVKGSLYEIDLAQARGGSISATRHRLAKNLTYDRLAYDGDGQLFALDGDRLVRHALGTAPLVDGVPVAGSSAKLAGAFTIGPAEDLGSGFGYDTLTAVAGGWLLGSTSSGEWDAVEVTPPGAKGKPTAVTHVLGLGGRTYADLVATSGGVYYGRGADGSLTWFADADPTDGNGSDIAGGKTIDESGWDQKAISVVPSTCGANAESTTGTAQRTVGRTRGYNGFGDGWCTEGAALMFFGATGMWIDIHGDAWAWANAARRAGWSVVADPEPRSVVVFQPNVQIGRDHAGALGHVAWVEAVKQRADGIWMFIREMNAYGGRGAWDTRWIKHNPAISAATGQPAMQYILAP